MGRHTWEYKHYDSSIQASVPQAVFQRLYPYVVLNLRLFIRNLVTKKNIWRWVTMSLVFSPAHVSIHVLLSYFHFTYCDSSINISWLTTEHCFILCSLFALLILPKHLAVIIIFFLFQSSVCMSYFPCQVVRSLRARAAYYLSFSPGQCLECSFVPKKHSCVE